MSNYFGTELTFKAESSDAIALHAELTEDKTGQVQSRVTFSATMQPENTIEKQSYLKVLIPREFTIHNAARVASTCLALWGFSDEIQCEIETERFAHAVYVRGGFDSETFTEASFGF